MKKSITRKGKSQSQKKRTRGQGTDNQDDGTKSKDEEETEEKNGNKVDAAATSVGSRAKKRTKRVAENQNSHIAAAATTSAPPRLLIPTPSMDILHEWMEFTWNSRRRKVSSTKSLTVPAPSINGGVTTTYSFHLHNDAISSILAFLDAKDFESSLTVSRQWYSAAQLRTSWPAFSLNQYISSFHHDTPSIIFSSSTRMTKVWNSQLHKLTQSQVFSNVRTLHLTIPCSVYSRPRTISLAHLSQLTSLTALDVRIDKDQLPALASALDSIKSHILVLKCHLSPPEVPFSLTSFGILLQLRVLCIHSSREVNSIAIVQLHSLEYFQGPDSDNETPELVYALRYLSVYHSLRHLTLTDDPTNTKAFWQPVQRSFDGRPIEDLPVARLVTLDIGFNSAEGVYESDVHDLCEIECVTRMQLYLVPGMDRRQEGVGSSLTPSSASALRNIARIVLLSLDVRFAGDPELIHDLGRGLTHWIGLKYLHIKLDCQFKFNFIHFLPSTGLPLLQELSIHVDEDLPDVDFTLGGFDALTPFHELVRLRLEMPPGRFTRKNLMSLLEAIKTLKRFERLDLPLDDKGDRIMQFPVIAYNIIDEMIKFHSVHIHLRWIENSKTRKWWNRFVGSSSSSSRKFELSPTMMKSPRLQQFRIFLNHDDSTSIYRVDCTSQILKWIDCTNESQNNMSNNSDSDYSNQELPASRLVGIELNPGPPHTATVE